MTLTDLLRSLNRFRRLVNVVALLTIGIGIFMAVSPPDRYRSTATVLVQPQLTEEGQPVAVQTIDFLVPSYLKTVDTRTFRSETARDVEPAARDAAIDIDASAESGTGIVTVTVSSTDRDATAPWAQALAERLADQTDDEFVTLTVVDDAVEADAPYAPNRALIVLIAIVLALVNGVLAAVIASAVRGRADRVTELRERFGALVLGEIPRLRRSQADLSATELVGTTSNPALADALQALRANVSLALADRPHPWLLVTSAQPSEGKSTVSTALALLFASVQRKTLLVDGDSRRPSAYRRLGVSVGIGLEGVAARGVEPLLQATESPWLRFLGSGHPDRHPAEIASTNLPILLRHVEEHGETLVVDAPPLPAAAETILYASACENVLLVIDARRRDLTNVERVITTLKDRDVHILGVVINRSRRRRKSSYYSRTPAAKGRGATHGAAPASPAAIERDRIVVDRG